ncbi:MAG: ABC transporter permease [Sandaracinaceae bacterium]|nr:ABC transporter permease [Sandaracinaceae bacterium]
MSDDDLDRDSVPDAAEPERKKKKKRKKKVEEAPVERPPVPSFVDGVMASVRLSYLRVLRGRKLRVVAIATLVVILFPAIVALLDRDADRAVVVTQGFNWGFFRLLLFLAPILMSSGAIADEVEERTLSFLTMRPTSRWALLLGRWLVSTGAAVAVIVLGVLLLHVIAYLTEPREMIDQLGSTARIAGASTLLVITYSSICLLWGVLVPEAATLLSVLYLGVIELCFGVVPGVLRFFSMSHFARELAGLPRWGFMSETVPEVPLWGCALVIVVVTGLFTLGALAIFRGTQTRFGNA